MYVLSCPRCLKYLHTLYFVFPQLSYLLIHELQSGGQLKHKELQINNAILNFFCNKMYARVQLFSLLPAFVSKFANFTNCANFSSDYE